jgi:integrase/recombinase XerD
MEVEPVLVQRVLMPGSGRESWTLLGDDGEVVEPAERYLAYLAAIERSLTRCGHTRSA